MAAYVSSVSARIQNQNGTCLYDFVFVGLIMTVVSSVHGNASVDRLDRSAHADV